MRGKIGFESELGCLYIIGYKLSEPSLGIWTGKEVKGRIRIDSSQPGLQNPRLLFLFLFLEHGHFLPNVGNATVQVLSI